MSTESMGHDLTRRDTADAPRCPMERLADRFMDAPKPKWLRLYAVRWPEAMVYLELDAALTNTAQIDDLINFLARVRG